MKNDNLVNERNERLFDAMLKIAADEALREEMDALPTDEELMKMYPFTESLSKKAYSVINKEFRVINRKKVIRAIVRVAAVFCVIIVLSASVLMANPASRNAILNFLIDIQHDHVTIDFGIGGATGTDYHDAVFRYVPEGFEFVSRQAMETVITYFFLNPEGYVIFMHRFLGRSLAAGLDAEYAHFSEIQLSTGLAYISVALYEHDFSTIMWAEEEDVISITTTLDVETLIELAETYMMRR